MKKIILIISLLLSFCSSVYAEYFLESYADKEKTISSYNFLDEFVKNNGINTRIGNQSVFLDNKFIGKAPYPLHLAVIFNDNEKIKKYISMGADVNIELEYPGMTPLILAVKNNNMQAVQMLIAAGADVKYETIRFNLSAIDFANNYDMASFLISKGANVNKINSYDTMTPLHKAVLLKDKKLISLYLPKSNMYQKEFFSYKDAFWYALSLRDIDIINMFINQGYKLSKQEYENIKFSINNNDIINMLSKIVDNNKKDEILPPEYSADKEILKQRIFKSDIVKKYPEIKDNPYKYIYHFSTYKTKEKPEYIKIAENYEYNNFKKIAREKYDISSFDYADEYYEDIMVSSVAENNLFLVKSILYAGYLNSNDYRTRSTAVAIYLNNKDMLTLLVKAQYDIYDCYPLIYDIGGDYECYHLIEDILQEPYVSGDEDRGYYEYPEIDNSESVMIYDVNSDSIISQSKADFYNLKRIVDRYSRENNKIRQMYNWSIANISDAENLTNHIEEGDDVLDNNNHALLFVKDETYKSQLDTLLNMGVNMYFGNNESSVFHFAGNPELLKIFLNHNLNVNVRSKSGKPLLFQAVESKSLESVKLLVENGANLDDLLHGASIISYSKIFGTEEISSYLQSKISEKGIVFQPDDLTDFVEKHKEDKRLTALMSMFYSNRLDKIYDRNDKELDKVIRYTIGFNGNIACVAGDAHYYKLVKMFIERGVEINVPCYYDAHPIIDPLAFVLAAGDIEFYEKNIDKITLKETKYSSAFYGAALSLDYQEDKNNGIFSNIFGDKKKDAGQNKVLEYLFNKKIFTPDDKILVPLLFYTKNFEEIFKYINIENYDDWNEKDTKKFGISYIDTANPLEVAIKRLYVDSVEILLKHNVVVIGKEDLLTYAKNYKLSEKASREQRKKLKKIIKLLEEYVEKQNSGKK